MRLESLRGIASTLPFRAIVAFAILYAHIHATLSLALDRFDYTWQLPTAGMPRFYVDEKVDRTLADWNRLVVSRWDSEHYMTIAMRGYDACKPKNELGPDEFPDDEKKCQLNFYPTYGFLGRYVAQATGYAIDYAMLLVSCVSSFVFLMLWTSPVITRSLGLGPTYLSLLLFNVFSFAFSLVTIQTEPLFLMCALLAYWCLARRWLLMGAIVAGAATAVRVTGLGVGVAFAVALIAIGIEEKPRLIVWLWRCTLMMISFWGIALLMAYFKQRFGDPLIYVHAHEREYHHGASIEGIVMPDTRILMKSLWSEPFDGVMLAAALLWFALGHRKGLEWFSIPEQAYWYALYFGVMGISMVGSADVGYLGVSRYALGALPLFFAMAGIMKRRPIILGIWLYISVVQYWGGSLCFYVGQKHADRFGACGYARHFVAE